MSKLVSCGVFDHRVKVYRDYFHLFYIPHFPSDDKTVEIRCNVCTEPLRSDTIQWHYADKTGTPFYLYSWLLLIIALFITSILIAGTGRKKNRGIYKCFNDWGCI
ncbi:MAG: hypothetical protein SGJ10_00845 [Bacteroidota bacterium]|nr:hypothetical protein [Bacteroidota bacterium]